MEGRGRAAEGRDAELGLAHALDEESTAGLDPNNLVLGAHFPVIVEVAGLPLDAEALILAIRPTMTVRKSVHQRHYVFLKSQLTCSL